jgi:phospholipase C
VRYRSAGLLFFLVVACGGIVACTADNAAVPALNGPPASESPGEPLSTPIKHVIVVIQENRSFDNLFATFPGANGTRVGLAEPMPAPLASACAAKGQRVIARATTIPLTEVSITGKGFPTTPPAGPPFGWNNDLAHDYSNGYLLDCDTRTSHPNASNPCRMDGFDLTNFGPDGEGPPSCTYTYQYVDPQQIQPYWDIAQQYVLADNAFQTQGSESFTAHQELIAGGSALDTYESIIDDPTGFPWGCDALPPSPPSQMGAVTSLLTVYGQYRLDQGPFPCLTYPHGTMRDLLDAKRISWKYYADEIYSWQNPKSNGPDIWSGFDAIKAVRYSKEWGTNVTWPDTNIFNDIKSGKLPAVAWVTPDGANSDHPDETKDNGREPVDTGPSWVASIVNAIGGSKYWDSSAIVILWDDSGGFYDHVAPPFYDDQGGLGFRFPMLIVSPYVKAHVEHTQYETTSVLKFIENNWGLKSLGQEDKRAASIASAFDFKMAPRAFKAIPAKYSLRFFLEQKPSGIPPDTR